MGGAPMSLHESWLLYLPWSVHGACMDHLFLCLFGTCSTPTLRCAHRPSYTSPPAPPRALDLSLAIVRIMDLLGNETARKWAMPVIGASSHTPCHRTSPVTSHTPCPSCPTHPTRHILHAPLSRPTCPTVAPHPSPPTRPARTALAATCVVQPQGCVAVVGT